MFSDHIHERFKAHALACFPYEAVGLVMQVGGVLTFKPCENIHPEPQTNFRIHGDEYVMAQEEGEVLSLLHSHVPWIAKDKEGKEFETITQHPTKADMELQKQLDIPFGISVCTTNESVGDPFYFGDGCPIPPLIGRTYLYGVRDCYELVRDYYRTREVNPFTLPVVPRDPDWFYQGEDLYADHLGPSGFKEIDPSEVRVGDACLMKVMTKDNISNHAAVVVEKGLLLHHLLRHLSMREPIAKWAPYVTKWVRHEGDF